MPDNAEERPQLVAAMLKADFYPGAPAAVELRETHISWVFLAGDLAYKVKKPVVFPFVDYGTPQRRREMCHEEVRLNRRLAPQIYLGVVGIACSDGRYSLSSEDDAQAIEYAVEMRRVQEDRSLAAIAGGGEIEDAQIELVAGRLARFHDEAPIAGPEHARIEVLAETLEENLTSLREAGAGMLAPGRLDAARTFTSRFLAARRGQLEDRARAGLVRDCHGDLRAEHVILPVGGPLYVYDCVEFNPALRQIDVAADIAFLVMDLARLGAEAPALRLIEEYRRAGGDPGDDPLAFFFASYRAWVRAKTACLRALELEERDPQRSQRVSEARELLDLGHRFAWRARRPLLLVVCGVAGAGKTTLARRLAELSGWSYVSSDLTRKRLGGLGPAQRGGEELYTPEMTMRTYAEMASAARRELERGGAAIVDATFHRRAERAAFREALGGWADASLVVDCRASTAALLARARRRVADHDRVSDAGPAVVRAQLAELEPPEEAEPEARLELTTEAPVEDLVVRIEAFVDRAVWAPVSATEPAPRAG